MDKNLVKFAEEIKKALGDNLISFIVYGSVATGENFKDSDYNTLIVFKKIDTACLKSVSKQVESWVKKGQPIPLIFTVESLKSSQDVFPIEFLDIIENHVLLSGIDVFKNMKISSKNLRLEIEKEFKSKLIRLRQSFITAGRDNAKLKMLLNRSFSSIIALIKGSIRLYGKKAPSKKIEILNSAPAAFKLNKPIFERILAMKEGKQDIPSGELETVFGQYMEEVEKMAAIIDRRK